MPLKHDSKKIPFCMSYKKLFLKDGLQDNHWVGQSSMKWVDRWGKNDERDNFEMDILDEGALDKVLIIPEKEWMTPPLPWKTIYEVIGDEKFKQLDVYFIKDFYSNANQSTKFLI